jgi:nitric oxide dioxygenase
MTPKQKSVIRQTWNQIAPIADQAASMFYDRLFETDPELRALFAATDMASQRKKLIEALAMVVGGLDQVEEIVGDLEALGRRHAGFGVTDHHYDAVGGAFLWTLNRGLGDAWTTETAAAWTAAYDLVASTMRAGAAAGQSTQGALAASN